MESETEKTDEVRERERERRIDRETDIDTTHNHLLLCATIKRVKINELAGFKKKINIKRQCFTCHNSLKCCNLSDEL